MCRVEFKKCPLCQLTIFTNSERWVSSGTTVSQSNCMQVKCIPLHFSAHIFKELHWFVSVTVTHHGYQWNTQLAKGHQWSECLSLTLSLFLCFTSSPSIASPGGEMWLLCLRFSHFSRALVFSLALPLVALILPDSLFSCIHPPLPTLNRPVSALLLPIFVSATALLVSLFLSRLLCVLENSVEK